MPISQVRLEAMKEWPTIADTLELVQEHEALRALLLDAKAELAAVADIYGRSSAERLTQRIDRALPRMP
jgi:hypothetical protein